MQTFYVVFIRYNHGVYNSWVEYQRNVLFYKGSIYKAYTSREQAIRAWVLYEPRWRRLDESSPFAVAKAQYALVEANRMQKVPYGSIISIYLFIYLFWVLCSMWFHACNIEVNVGCPHLFSI